MFESMSHVDPEELNEFLDKVNAVTTTIKGLSNNDNQAAIDKADKLLKQFENEKKEKESKNSKKSNNVSSDSTNGAKMSQLYRKGDGWSNSDHLYYCQRCKIEILYDIYDFNNNDTTLQSMIEQFNKECDDFNTNNKNKTNTKNQEKIRCGACPNCNNSNKNIVVTAQVRKNILEERVEHLKREYQRKQDRRAKWEKYTKMKANAEKSKTMTDEKDINSKIKSKRNKYFTDYQEWDLWEPEIDFDEYTEDGYIPNIPEAKAMALDMQKRHKKKQEQMRAATKAKEEGNKAMKSQDYSGAIRHYSIGIDFCRDFKALYTNRGLAYMKTGQYSKCIEDCNAVIDMVTYIDTDQKNSDLAFKAYLRRANGHKLLGNLEDALTDARMCLKMRPKRQEVISFIDDLQVLIYNERQRTKLKASMKERENTNEQELRDFDSLFDQMVTYFHLDKQSSSNQHDKHTDKLLNKMNRLLSSSFDYCIRFADRNGIELVCRYLQLCLQKLQKTISNFVKSGNNSNHNSTNDNNKNEDHNNLEEKKTDNDDAVTTTNSNSKSSGGAMKLIRKDKPKKTSNGNKISSNVVSAARNREEIVKMRVEMEMQMRSFSRLFMILNYCLDNEINLPFLSGKRTQIGFDKNVEENNDSKTSKNKKGGKNETEQKDISNPIEVAKAELKKDKNKKKKNAIVQQNNKQMQLIVGSLIFYVIRDFSKYTFDLQRESMKFVSIATSLDSISSWLCQIHSKMIMKSIIEVLAFSNKDKTKKNANTLKKRKNAKQKDSKGSANSIPSTTVSTEEMTNLERGFDLEGLEFLFVTLIHFLDLKQKHQKNQFLHEMMRFDKPYIFVGLVNKLNEFGNYILDSKSQLDEFSSKMINKSGDELKTESDDDHDNNNNRTRKNKSVKSAGTLMRQEMIFLQKQHIVSIIFKVLSKVFVNEQMVKAFVKDELVTARVKSLLKHLTRLTDVFMVFEKYHLPNVVKILMHVKSDGESAFADQLLTQHGITMNQIAKCINVMLSLVHHGSSHSIFLELNVHCQLFEMIGMFHDAKHREMGNDKILSNNIENYNLVIDSIQDNILGFLDKMSIYPEFDTMIETSDFTKYSLILSKHKKDVKVFKSTNKTMKFWDYVLVTLTERQISKTTVTTSNESTTDVKQNGNHNNSSTVEEKETEEKEKEKEKDRNANEYYFEACCIRMLLRWMKRCLVGHASGASTNPYSPQIVETVISENFSLFCKYLTKDYLKQNTIVANITLLVKQFLIFCKNYNLYNKLGKGKKCVALRGMMIEYIMKNDTLVDIMNLFRNDDKTVRRNAVTLMAQLATFDDSLKDKIRDIGAMKAMYQLQREIV